MYEYEDPEGYQDLEEEYEDEEEEAEESVKKEDL